MTSLRTAQCRHSKYYLAKLHDLSSRYREGGQETSNALTGFLSECDQFKRGQAYAAEWIGREDWGADFCLGYAAAGTLLLSLTFPPDERIEWLESGLHAAKLTGQVGSEAEIWGQLGAANDALGRWNISVRLYRESLKITRRLDNRKEEGRILGSLGLVYTMLGDHNEARISLEKAVVMARENNDREAEGRHLGSLGLISKGHESIEYFDQALEIARALGDRDGQISHLGCLAMAWLQEGQTLLNSSNSRGREIHPNIIMRNTRPDGSIPQYLKDKIEEENRCGFLLRKAEDYFTEAISIAREIGNDRAEARQLGNLGMLRYVRSNFQAALDCYKEALAKAKKIGDHENQVRQLKNMRSAYKLLDNHKEARRIGRQLKELSNQVGPTITDSIVEQLGGDELDPFHEDYWRVSREEDIKQYWSDYYSIHIGE